MQFSFYLFLLVYYHVYPFTTDNILPGLGKTFQYVIRKPLAVCV